MCVFFSHFRCIPRQLNWRLWAFVSVVLMQPHVRSVLQRVVSVRQGMECFLFSPLLSTIIRLRRVCALCPWGFFAEGVQISTRIAVLSRFVLPRARTMICMINLTHDLWLDMIWPRVSPPCLVEFASYLGRYVLTWLNDVEFLLQYMSHRNVHS